MYDESKPLPSRVGNMVIGRNKSQLEMEETVDTSDSPAVRGQEQSCPKKEKSLT